MLAVIGVRHVGCGLLLMLPVIGVRHVGCGLLLMLAVIGVRHVGCGLLLMHGLAGMKPARGPRRMGGKSRIILGDFFSFSFFFSLQDALNLYCALQSSQEKACVTAAHCTVLSNALQIGDGFSDRRRTPLLSLNIPSSFLDCSDEPEVVFNSWLKLFDSYWLAMGGHVLG